MSFKRLVKCLVGLHHWVECSCGTSIMCIWCYSMKPSEHVWKHLAEGGEGDSVA